MAQAQIIEVRETYGTDYYVYRVSEGRDAPQFAATLVRVCPSIGMAREVAAGL